MCIDCQSRHKMCYGSVLDRQTNRPRRATTQVLTRQRHQLGTRPRRCRGQQITAFRRPVFQRTLYHQRECKCKCKCRFIERDYVTPLMRYRLECPANRYVLKSRLNCSESTAGFLTQSGSEFQTVGPATEKARVTKVPRREIKHLLRSLSVVAAKILVQALIVFSHYYIWVTTLFGVSYASVYEHTRSRQCCNLFIS